MGLLGERLHQRDVAIGIVLAMSLGLGLLFLHFFTAYATQATALLFGNVLGVDAATVWTLLLLGIVAVAALAAIARPLLFASLQPELAEAKGVSLRLLSVLFLAIVALAVAECAQIVGVLLVFALMVGPAAAAQRLTTRLLARHRAVGRAGAGRGMARARARLLHRLADQLLDHRAERRRLSDWRRCREACSPYNEDATGSASVTLKCPLMKSAIRFAVAWLAAWCQVIMVAAMPLGPLARASIRWAARPSAMPRPIWTSSALAADAPGHDCACCVRSASRTPCRSRCRRRLGFCPRQFVVACALSACAATRAAAVARYRRTAAWSTFPDLSPGPPLLRAAAPAQAETHQMHLQHQSFWPCWPACLLPLQPLLAHGFAGPHMFISTLLIDDPNVADEARLPTFSFLPQPNDGGATPGLYSLDFEFDKRITENFGFSVGDGYQWLHTPGARNRKRLAEPGAGPEIQDLRQPGA